MGNAAQVAPIDKLSVILVAVFGVVFLGEKFSLLNWLDVGLVAGGVLRRCKMYHSNMHRVKNNRSNRDRYSLPFFYDPYADSVIEPISTCVTADHPRRFPACTSAEHMTEMFRRSYGYLPAA